jgi:hypothetical protein
MTSLKENLDKVEAAISATCRAAGRQRESVELMAVSKTYSAETIAEAAQLGLRLFGENRVQEFASKAPAIETLRRDPVNSMRVHLIGHLQSNKSARAAELFDAVDSVDSLRLAERLDDAAEKLGRRLPILIEVKISSEETKSGIDPESDETARLLERLPDLPHLEMRGLMTIAPWGVAPEITRDCFRTLRTYRDCWATAHPRLAFDVLSMGMSGDFALAIEEGATRIRIGTALFGKRKPWPNDESPTGAE